MVLKKYTRSRRINSTEEDHSLGQEVCSDDMQVFTNMEPQTRGSGDNNAGDELDARQNNGRKRAWDEVN